MHDREKLQRAAVIPKPLGYALTLHQTRFHRAANPQGFAPKAGGSAPIALPPGRSLPDGPPGNLQVLD
jgi:hypothetical protein